MFSVPDVESYLAGSNVFVTGVTGFVGLALVEKLLRCVPEISTIYVLIRPKKGKSVEDRLNEIKDSSIFDVIIKHGKWQLLDKLVALEGSIDAKNLGMSRKDLETAIINVNYVFHCAATLDFEASLKTTVEVNLIGTRRIVHLCKRIRDLKAMVHVSSAYVNSDKKSAEEILYPPPADVDSVVELVRTLPNSSLEEMTHIVLKGHPNTYTFTKALAEHEVANSYGYFPSCIVRPSMIVGSWKEPMPGWTNSKNGPQGFIMGAAMGVVRRLPVGKDLVYDYVPVDTVVNTLIVGAVHAARQREFPEGSKFRILNESPIFHCTSSTYNPFRWTLVEDKINDLLQEYALAQAVWYPHLKLLPSVTRYRISAPIFHMIPAYFFDTLTKLAGGRPKLVRLHTNVNQSLERLEPFIFQEWSFFNSKQMDLHNALTPTDQETFGMDLTTLEWYPFFEDMSKGVRRYLHKEEDETLPQALRKNKVMRILNITVQVALFALIWLMIKFVLGSGLQAAMALPVIYVLYNML